MTDVSSLNATRAWRTSPAGSCPNSSRNRPDDPPESIIVTTAVRSTGYFFNPESTAKVPVPPPITKIFFFVSDTSVPFYSIRSFFVNHLQNSFLVAKKFLTLAFLNLHKSLEYRQASAPNP